MRPAHDLDTKEKSGLLTSVDIAAQQQNKESGDGLANPHDNEFDGARRDLGAWNYSHLTA
ncbi:hypothetical protein SLS62_006979 [Diatrype stigma]|uniref:Uncharacterized protein n=1 Tax=Diatrype stigma TaxID=117547 RepID=A0AAN9UM24_9PEZI